MALRLYGPAVLHARLRDRLTDFVVEEIDAFDADGAGEHLLLTVRKSGLTTDDLVRRIARWAQVKPRDVGYAGLKDKHGVTTQRISVWLPGREDPDIAQLNDDALNVLHAARHTRKLQRGASLGNAFALTLRDVNGNRPAIEQRLAEIATTGFANYFGAQRFGRGDNVSQALAMFRGRRVDRNLRSLLNSAARSAIFNAQLDRRIAMSRVLQITDGDIAMLEGSNSVFGPVVADADLEERLRTGDIAMTAPMWGDGELATTGEIRDMESQVVAGDETLKELARGLRRSDLKQQRRAASVIPGGLKHEWLAEDVLRLQFTLRPGSYATALLHELGEVRDVTAGDQR